MCVNFLKTPHMVYFLGKKQTICQKAQTFILLDINCKSTVLNILND